MEDDNTTRNCKRSSTTESSSSSSSTSTLFSKKIKLDSPFQNFNLGSVDDFDIHNHRHHSLFSVSPDTSSTSGGFSTGAASRSSSSDSSGVLKDSSNSVDPEVKSSVETESSLTCTIGNKFRETTSSSAMETSKATTVKSSRKIRLPAEKLPCEVEMDEFFAEAEKKEQKRFANKYNYDIAKDSPLEGRYRWVRLKP